MSRRKKGISLVILVAIISSILSSLLTVILVKDNLGSKATGNSTPIVVNDDGKSQNIYQAVAEKATPSVVGITTTSVDTNNMFAIPTETQGVGTGIIVDSNGYILTNSHVISDGQATSVNVLFNDGSTTSGKVVWFDQQLDLAIVKVDKTGLTPAEFADSDKVKVGDISIAIGNPLGLDFQKTVTQGIISGLDRTIQTEKTNMTGLLQTDASINAGNSGGPLLNQKGQVIGINTAKASQAEGLGFAIPINTAKSIVEEVIKTGKYEKVTLGIKGTDVSNYEAATDTKLSTDKGVYVAEVISGSAAEKAGVKVGDIITKVGDTDITGMNDLNKKLYTFSKGTSTKITVNRGGKAVTINVNF
ncbi:trypsin-like peptidase domain-containing protein [Clostridioides sp. ES-S-0108-01]|uniref:serine protease HtrA n=1 Tax=Clostridioides sp. ES-S-0108-01 TaxID=2770773 RepID=UPI001D0C3860|nr:trypsin-like peptidase domain-containing protein [Clostridioides sp. ES-S-0108-01]UDN50883.1 trypsin-like peptidase domain-containing protein [Clostridioides sp. ES-S-0107-01]